jgi:hypothetical protein
MDQPRDMISFVTITFTDGTEVERYNVEALHDWPSSPCAVYRDENGIIYWYPLANIKSIVVGRMDR